MKQRVNVYVDGFNFYYGLKAKSWKKYYWLDLVTFFDSFMKPNQFLQNVYYFSAIPIDRDKADRQDLFFSANRNNTKFKLILGKFVVKTIQINQQSRKTYEEKQTDVNIAVEMIKHVVNQSCDVSILVSGDSDLIPPIDFIKTHDSNHRVYCYFPPLRFTNDITSHSNAFIKLNRYENRFKKAVLPNIVVLSNGHTITKPAEWI